MKSTKLKALALVITALLCLNCKAKKEETLTTKGEETGLAGEITIFHAGSLAVPFRDISAAFMKKHPGVKVEHESGGSRRMIRQITQLGKKADILASSDYVAIEQLMMPDFADWYVVFAGNRIVIAYTEESEFAGEIDADNWYDILLREGVIYGRGDHNMDPCGYRTLLVWKLAEKHYKKEGLYDRIYEGCGEKNVRPKSEDLIALLQSGDMDYAFEYYSVAQQHSLSSVSLPPEIDLSGSKFKDLYSTVEVEVTGKKPGEVQIQRGEPILYAVTIPANAVSKDLALEWIKFLISGDGHRILKANFQTPLSPPLASGYDRVPASLKKLVEGF